MSEPTQAEKDAMYATSLKTIASLREQLDAAQQQLTQARRDSDSLQHLYESTSVTESVIFGWKDRPVGSSAEAARTLIQRYEQAQQQIDTLTKERNDARHQVMELIAKIDKMGTEV